MFKANMQSALDKLVESEKGLEQKLDLSDLKPNLKVEALKASWDNLKQ